MTLSRIPPAQGQSGAGGNAGTPQEPAGGGTPLVVYSPAQIRAAYRQPPVTQAGTPLAAADAAALGAGQTIYLIGAHAGPNLLADLGQFDAAFGLPACSELPLPAATALPLPAAAAGAGCTLSVAYIDGTGARTDAVPAYDEAWAFELDMDVQWAHATAPLARLIVIAAPSGDVGQLAAAVQLANAMGPGVVSMSFGAIEGEYVRALEGAFEGHAAMSYVASAGDAGRGVAWPASSPTVLAVGGTTLHFTGDAPREESAWGDTGGGWSAYFDAPDWQASPAPPPPRNARHHTAKRHVMRSVADVAFNADPWSGQFILVSAPGAASPNWYSGGGTSIGAPQWAGLIAVSNAQRALAGKPPLGTVQARLYQGIAAVAGLYAGAFDDVQSGGDAQFAAHIGYDQPTGLGTPNTADLLAQLAAS
jgi:subtilase family serine protease